MTGSGRVARALPLQPCHTKTEHQNRTTNQNTRKKPRRIRFSGVFLFAKMRRAVSRVMSWTVICLVLPSPAGSSNLPGQCLPETGRPAGRRSVLFGLASDGVYMCPGRCRPGGGLLHRRCTLTGRAAGGLFLLHFPGSRLHRTLSGILPFEARTFLTCSLSSLQPRPSARLRTVLYHRSLRLTRKNRMITAPKVRSTQQHVICFWRPIIAPGFRLYDR